MNSRTWSLGAAVAFSVAVASTAVADEVLVVEPLNTQIVLNLAQTVFIAAPVNRPETWCGNPGGNPNKLVPCYEFGVTYATYDTAGQQILHLQECNLVPPTDDRCELPAYNKCAGNFALDPFQIKGPICGKLSVQVLPITSTEAVTLGPFAERYWDGTSRTNLGEVYLETTHGGVFDNQSYRLPRIRLPVSDVHGILSPGAQDLALVVGRHGHGPRGINPDIGFLNPFNRLFIFDQHLGDVFNTVATPMLFGK